MPTGYTEAIVKGIGFNDFVMQCARGMGALVMMRDEPMNAPIPECFEPSDWYPTKIAETLAELERLNAMTEAEADQAADKTHMAEIASHQASIDKNKGLSGQYHAMLAEVEAWTPPSPDHQEFKTFMVDQIKGSIKFDCNISYLREPKKLTGAAWKLNALATATHELGYYRAENAKEIERTESRNTWLRQLRESLKSTTGA